MRERCWRSHSSPVLRGPERGPRLGDVGTGLDALRQSGAAPFFVVSS
jgi:hypothetical protein